MQTHRVVLGTYNTMPSGSSEAEFERRYQSCWRPFLSVLYRFPEVSAVQHYSGTVLKWLELRHPEFIMLLNEMLLRKQIELLGGAFFSPILSLLPSSDRLGQIELFTTYIRKTFGKRPMGLWLHEYVWEPGFASQLQSCGFNYTFLPEAQFQAVLPAEASLAAQKGQPVVTEDQGRTICVFPVIDIGDIAPAPLPFEAAFEEAKTRNPAASLYTLMMDGALSDVLWQSSGLESPDILFERSFAWFQLNLLDTETTTPARYMKAQKRFDMAYFPSGASCRLMRAAGGASPRNLVAIAESSRRLYAKMQYVHILAAQVRGDKSRKKSAHEELWKGQCGAAYWQGPEGGVLRPELRAAAYSALLEAEKMTRGRASFSQGLILTDMDFDGEKEVLYQGADINSYIHLKGAAIFELDSFRTRRNYVDTPADKAGCPRGAFMDKFFASGSFATPVADFSSQWYSLQESDRPANVAVFSVSGSIGPPDGTSRAVSVRKTYLFRKATLSVDYEVRNESSEHLAFRFASEVNLLPSIAANCAMYILQGREKAPLRASCSLDDDIEEVTGEAFRIEPVKSRENIELRSDHPFALMVRSIASEQGLLPRYQGSSFLCGWDMELPPDGLRRVALTLSLEH